MYSDNVAHLIKFLLSAAYFFSFVFYAKQDFEILKVKVRQVFVFKSLGYLSFADAFLCG